MILTESENRILNNVKLIRKEYDFSGLKSNIIYHTDIFTKGAGYIPFQLLDTHVFGFGFRIIGDKLILQLAFSNKNRKLYKNDIIRFVFNNETLEYKILGGGLKDIDNLNTNILIVSPEDVKVFMFDHLKRIEVEFKKAEIEFLGEDLKSTLDNYNFSEHLYHTVVKKLTVDIINEFVKDKSQNEFSKLNESF